MRRVITDLDELRAIHESGRGFVHNPFDKRLHRAACHWVGQMGVAERKWFYESFEQAEADLRGHHARFGGGWRACPTCAPQATDGHGPTRMEVPTAPVQDRSAPVPTTAGSIAEPEVRRERDRVTVTARTYVPFEPKTDETRRLRSMLRDAARSLEADEGEVLHAVFDAAAPRGSDVENLLLYNVDSGGGCFSSAARHGLRFELGTHSDDHVRYEYRLAAEDATFEHWDVGRVLAGWDPCPLGATPPRRVDQVWLAQRRHTRRVADEPLDPTAAFGVRLVIHAPPRTPLAPLVKPLIDGVVVSLQAHGDLTALDEVASRVAHSLDLSPQSVARMLTSPVAPLGTVRRLAWPWRDVVQWNPDDDRCVAAELLLAPSESGFAIAGDVVELLPAGPA